MKYKFFKAVTPRAIELTRQHLDTALELPRINLRPGAEYQDDNRRRGMVIGWDHRPKERIGPSWIGNGRSNDGWMPAITNDDDGETWSKPCFVIDLVNTTGMQQRRTFADNLWLASEAVKPCPEKPVQGTP